MKKKGFTLIELLAVIVILAIITVIAVPKIIDVIEKSERTAFGESAGLMAKAAELKYSDGNLTNTQSDETYEFENGNFKSGSPTLTFKGDKPNSGIIVQKQGKTTLAVISKNEKWCAIKNEGERLAKVYKIGKEIEKENCKIGYTGNGGSGDSGSSSGGSGGSETGDKKIICKRATTLHTEECTQTNSTYYCSGAGYTSSGSKGTSTIIYGNLGTSGTLTSGDAFDCDVNGDGEYNPDTERFYYVSDYYNTSTKEFESDTATLIYYNNVSGGNPNNYLTFTYDTSGENWNGPVTAMEQLPTTSQWSNVSLKNKERAILSETGTNEARNETLPSNFSYLGYAARFLSVQELENACNMSVTIGKINDDCIYLVENTSYAQIGASHDYWLENPDSYIIKRVWRINGDNSGTLNGYTASKSCSVRPVIEVSKNNILY